MSKKYQEKLAQALEAHGRGFNFAIRNFSAEVHNLNIEQLQQKAVLFLSNTDPFIRGIGEFFKIKLQQRFAPVNAMPKQLAV